MNLIEINREPSVACPETGEVVLAPEMRSKAPVIALEINTGHGWRDVTVAEDYSEELEDLTGAPWRPGDDADRPEDRI